MRLLLAIVFALGAGCGEAGNTGGTVRKIQCASVVCVPDDAGIGSTCCSSDNGVTGKCEPFPTACSMGSGSRFDCGGPENCIPGAVCCFTGGKTQCVPANTCTEEGVSSGVICHDATVCTGGKVCCPLAKGSTFGLCVTGPCPSS